MLHYPQKVSVQKWVDQATDYGSGMRLGQTLNATQEWQLIGTLTAAQDHQSWTSNWEPGASVDWLVRWTAKGELEVMSASVKCDPHIRNRENTIWYPWCRNRESINQCPWCTRQLGSPDTGTRRGPSRTTNAETGRASARTLLRLCLAGQQSLWNIEQQNFHCAGLRSLHGAWRYNWSTAAFAES